MVISNNWENINNLKYQEIKDQSGKNYILKLLNPDSADKLAEAIGFTTVTPTFQHYTIKEVEYPAAGTKLIVPTAIYPYGFSFIYENVGGAHFRLINLVSGTPELNIKDLPDDIYFSLDASYLILRPIQNRGFVIKRGNGYVLIFDRMINPKTGRENWCAFDNHNNYLYDLFEGEQFSVSSALGSDLYKQISGSTSFGNYIFNKLWTAFSPNGIRNATSIYRPVVDYSTASKTVVINGHTYTSIGGYYYIQLAD